MYQILLPVIFVTAICVFVYTKIRIPKNLQHIPHQYAYKWMKDLFSREHLDFRVKEILEVEYAQSKVQLEWRFDKIFVRVMSPEAAKKIYNDTTTFPKFLPSDSYPNRLFSNFLGDSVVFSSHQLWRKHRKVVNPPFKKQFEVKTFVDTTRQFFSLVDGNEKRYLEDVHRYMQRITMDCLGKDVLGVEFNSIENIKVPFLTAYNFVMEGVLNLFYFVIPQLDVRSNPLRRPYFEALDELNGIFKDILAEKRRALESNEVDESKLDLLSLLVKASQDETNQFTDLDIQNNVTTFLLAGHDTTAFALTAALHLLAENPDVQNKARREVMQVMGYTPTKCDSSQAIAPTLEQTKSMNYLFAVMKETMRMYPSVARLPDRLASEDVEIDGYLIPKGTGILLDTYCTHRDPENFKNPDNFIPERFLNEFGEISKDPVAWSPFGGGTRLCLGMNFSLLEQKVVLAMILCRYRIQNSKLDVSFRPLLLPESSSLELVPLTEDK